MNREQLIKELDKIRKGKTIVACCGCFEIFHIGHLEYLEGAKKLGNILIVGVNTDDYIKEHKKRTPIFSLDDRMRVLSGLECVDYVFSFDEKTFEQSLKEIKPNIFAKGIDRKDILEADICEKNNIKIARIGDVKKSNSSELRKYFKNGDVKVERL